MRFPDLARRLPPCIRPSAAGSLPAHGETTRRRTGCGLAAALLLATAAAPLAGCTRPDAFAPACPQLALLADGADLTRFNGHGRDVTDLVLDAHLTAVPAACKHAEDDPHAVEAMLKVAMSLGRGPAMAGRTVDVPYFVAVTEGDRVLDRQAYALRVEFPPNADRISATGEEITLLFPVTREKSAAAYQIWVSFQLTPEELAYNRGQRTP